MTGSLTGPVWAVVVAAGSGTRFGGQKQFGLLGSDSVLALAVGSVAGVVDGVVVVLPADLDAEAEARIIAGLGSPPSAVVRGRDTRAGSVRAGLGLVPEDCEIVVVHDAARPLASVELCEAVVAAVVGGADGAIPGLPISDTVKQRVADRVVATVERGSLVAVQTPQAFRAAVLRRAHDGEADATDDAGLVEAAGGSVVVVPGEVHNFKITAPEDLELAGWWLEKLAHRRSAPETAGA